MSAKPDTHTAMRQLIEQIRTSLPFDRPESQLCIGPCEGCSMKLLNYLDTELLDWEARLGDGEIPTLGDVSRLAKSAKKIYRVLEKNGLLAEPSQSAQAASTSTS